MTDVFNVLLSKTGVLKSGKKIRPSIMFATKLGAYPELWLIGQASRIS